MNKKFSYFIFDLDGVIFDSKKNMELSWKSTCLHFNIKIKFKKYFERIGIPFNKILASIGVNSNSKIEKYYKSESIKFIQEIKIYDKIISTLYKLKKKKITFSIVTSKDLTRSKILLKKYNIKPRTLHCPGNRKNNRGKPYPDLIINALKKNKKQIHETCYVGDTYYDFIASKKAKVSFVFAKYGYGKNRREYKLSIDSFQQIMKFVN